MFENKKQRIRVTQETRDLNKKWVDKQNKMQKEWSGYYWGMTVASIMLVLLLIYALIVNFS